MYALSQSDRKERSVCVGVRERRVGQESTVPIQVSERSERVKTVQICYVSLVPFYMEMETKQEINLIWLTIIQRDTYNLFHMFMDLGYYYIVDD